MKTGTKIALGAGAVVLGFIVINKMRGAAGPLPEDMPTTMTAEEQIFYPNGADSPARQTNPYRQYVRGTAGSRM